MAAKYRRQTSIASPRGVRFTPFYNTARCCPTRASILTGLHPHQASVSHMVADLDEDGYRGDLNERCVTIAEALKPAGYATYMSGKWHVTRHGRSEHSWPRQRGFDRFYGIITGAANYYQPKTLQTRTIRWTWTPCRRLLTDAISDQAVTYIQEHAAQKTDAPFSSTPRTRAALAAARTRGTLRSTRAASTRAGIEEERLQRMRNWAFLTPRGR